MDARAVEALRKAGVNSTAAVQIVARRGAQWARELVGYAKKQHKPVGAGWLVNVSREWKGWPKWYERELREKAEENRNILRAPVEYKERVMMASLSPQTKPDGNPETLPPLDKLFDVPPVSPLVTFELGGRRPRRRRRVAPEAWEALRTDHGEAWGRASPPRQDARPEKRSAGRSPFARIGDAQPWLGRRRNVVSTTEETKLLDIEEAATIIGCPVNTLRDWLKRDTFAPRVIRREVKTTTGMREKTFLPVQLVADITTWRAGGSVPTTPEERVSITIKFEATIYGK